MISLCRDIDLGGNYFWEEPEKEYTSSTRKLSAVWPSLRHGKYSWKVIKDDRDSGLGNSVWARIEKMNYDTFPCHSPLVLRCGETQVSTYCSYSRRGGCPFMCNLNELSTISERCCTVSHVVQKAQQMFSMKYRHSSNKQNLIINQD